MGCQAWPWPLPFQVNIGVDSICHKLMLSLIGCQEWLNSVICLNLKLQSQFDISSFFSKDESFASDRLEPVVLLHHGWGIST